MKRTAGITRCISLVLLLLFLVPQISFAAATVRTCLVKEVLKGGIYVYLRCRENDKDVWLATVARDFKNDESVSFVDAPPMTDFYSKHLNRTFPEVIFTDLLPPGGKK